MFCITTNSSVLRWKYKYLAESQNSTELQLIKWWHAIILKMYTISKFKLQTRDRLRTGTKQSNEAEARHYDKVHLATISVYFSIYFLCTMSHYKTVTTAHLWYRLVMKDSLRKKKKILWETNAKIYTCWPVYPRMFFKQSQVHRSC